MGDVNIDSESWFLRELAHEIWLVSNEHKAVNWRPFHTLRQGYCASNLLKLRLFHWKRLRFTALCSRETDRIWWASSQRIYLSETIFDFFMWHLLGQIWVLKVEQSFLKLYESFAQNCSSYGVFDIELFSIIETWLPWWHNPIKCFDYPKQQDGLNCNSKYCTKLKGGP